MSALYKVRLLDGTVAKIEDCSRNIEVVEVLSFPDGYKSLYAEFEGCINLEKIPPIPPTVTDCDRMLAGCVKFNQDIELPEHVISASHMLCDCTAFNSTLTVSCYVQNYSNLVKGCTSLDTSKIVCTDQVMRDRIIEDIHKCDNKRITDTTGPGYIVRLKNGEYVEILDIENRDDIDAVIVRPGEY